MTAVALSNREHALRECAAHARRPSLAAARGAFSSAASAPTLATVLATVLAGAIAFAPFAAHPVHADIYTVRPGQEWSRLSAELKPGDEVHLSAGLHVAAVLEGVRGNAAMPIVIRPAEPRGLVEIAADREAIKLVDAQHVRIERIAVRKARRAGILVESTVPGEGAPPRSVGIVLSDIYIAGVAGLAEESGIVMRGVADLEILRTRVENCAGAGILLEDCETAGIRRVQCIAAPDKPSRAGIELAGRVWGAVIDDASIKGPFGSALSCGTRSSSARTAGDARANGQSSAVAPSPDGARPPPPARGSTSPGGAQAVDRPANAAPRPLVRNLSASNLRISMVRRALDIGSCTDSVVRNTTILDPSEEIYRVSAPPPGFDSASIRFLDNLITWQPGGLRRFGSLGEGVSPASFELGPNLWWSRELPLALELLGPKNSPFPGTVATPQRLDLDPRLDRDLQPSEPGATAFGANRR